MRRPSAIELYTGLAILHLSFVIAFVWGRFEFVPPGPVAAGLRTYGNLSGVFRDYGFFAPNVASGTKAGFLVDNLDGTPPAIVPLSSDNHEIALRLSSLIKMGAHDERAQDLFAQSWAAAVMARHPRSKRVVVMVQSMALPTMDRYRDGERPNWRATYVGEFVRR